jgi:hypothetical protein
VAGTLQVGGYSIDDELCSPPTNWWTDWEVEPVCWSFSQMLCPLTP